MRLYHGSNMEVDSPEIRQSARALDFGSGFYLTSNKQQAEKWAKSVVRRRQSGEPIVNIYEFDEGALDILNTLIFKVADSKWLDFVVANRKGLFVDSHEIVIGPVANDSTLPVIDDYMTGRYTQEEAVRRLLPQKLTDQYAFCTARALTYISFVESEVVL